MSRGRLDRFRGRDTSTPRSPASLELAEAMPDHVAGDPPAQCRSVLVGMAIVEAGQDARVVHVAYHLAEAVEVMRGAGRATVERERDAARAEERLERLGDRGRVAGVRGRVLGVRRRRPQRLPCRVGVRRARNL